MEREQELAIIRRAYAKQVLAEWQVDDPRLELAFTQVRREDFLSFSTHACPSARRRNPEGSRRTTGRRTAPLRWARDTLS